MALIGPVIKNELLLFLLTVALAAGWLLAGARRREPAMAEAPASGPEARLLRASRARETSLKRWIGVVGLGVVAFLATAFVRQSQIPERAPATPVTITAGAIHLDAAPLHDGRLHFFAAPLGESLVRFFAIEVNGELRTCFDACEICGDKGYFQD